MSEGVLGSGISAPSGRLGIRAMIVLASFSVMLLAGAALGPSAARAGEASEPSSTVWLCKPGMTDNPCLDGSFGGTRYRATGTLESFAYVPATDAAFDCFYIYPTQSQQEGPNADLSRDPELKAVAVNQAAQFSRICDVYAPVYRQYTLSALGSLQSETGPEVERVRDVAYAGVRDGFADFIESHSRGRGFVLIGHSQGASHLSRLIDEVIDPDPSLRRRMISAIVPGSNNIYVPKGEVIGGNLRNIPACEKGDQLGCVMAWSLYLYQAESGLPENATFGRLETGYWVYPEARPDSRRYEVLCVNPTELSGHDGRAIPLANLPAFAGGTGGANPWLEFSGFYEGSCRSGRDSSWLDIKPVVGISNGLLDGLLGQINTGAGGLHVGDMNLVLGNLIEIVSGQGERYVAWRKAVGLSEAADRALRKGRRDLDRARSRARKAARACRTSGSRSACRKARAVSKKKRALARRVGVLSAGARKARASADRAYGSA